MTIASSTPKIRLRNLRKRFGQKLVLDGIDLDIMPGTSTVVIGGSGSGKSVLLKCILGLLEHAEPRHSRVDPSASPLATSCLRSPSADYRNIPCRRASALFPKNAKTALLPEV